MRKARIVCLSTMLIAVCSCTSMSRIDRAYYRQIRGAGLDTHVADVKDPRLAACLNLLPGIGNFYLASGTEASEHWVYGTLNLLTWPYSILWGVPEAGIDASTINKQETIYYYRFDPQGRARFTKATGEPLAQ